MPSSTVQPGSIAPTTSRRCRPAIRTSSSPSTSRPTAWSTARSKPKTSQPSFRWSETNSSPAKTRPSAVLAQRMTAVAYEWHNYGKSTIGNRSDIERVPVDNLREFYKRFYQPDNAVLVVAGKFDEDKGT